MKKCVMCHCHLESVFCGGETGRGMDQGGGTGGGGTGGSDRGREEVDGNRYVYIRNLNEG